MGKLKIYQLLLRAFCATGDLECSPRLCGKFNDITSERLEYLKSLSINAVWYTGVPAHGSRSVYAGIQDCARCIVKGNAGSPYAVRDWYDVDPDLADSVEFRMAEFEAMVERTHQAGMKVITDFVPNHVFRQYHSETDNFTDENFYLLEDKLRLPDGLTGYAENPAKATGNNCFSPTPSAYDWYETVKLNYGNRSTWDKMLRILKFWLSKGVDGFRCDMVELVPVEFFGWAFTEIRKEYPDAFFIGEVYDVSNYQTYLQQGSFDLLYDKSIAYDSLMKVMKGSAPASTLTYLWQRRDHLGPQYREKLLNFIENHDERRIASDFMLRDGKNAIAGLMYSLLFDRTPFLLYFGQELGERGMQAEGYSGMDGRTSIFDYCTVPSVERMLLNRSTEQENNLLEQYRRYLALSDDERFSLGQNFDLCYCNGDTPGFDTNSHFAFLRSYKGKVALVVLNFSDSTSSVTVKLPQHAFDVLGLKPHTPHTFITTPGPGSGVVVML